jgi:hypothetical protein
MTLIKESNPGYQVLNDFDKLPNDTIFEAQGGHCLAIITDNITVQANSYTPHDILSLHANLLTQKAASSSGVNVFYVALDESKIADAKGKIYDTQEFSYLMGVLAEHHNFFENLSVTDGNFYFYYSFSGVSPQTLSQITSFWQTQIKRLSKESALKRIDKIVSSQKDSRLLLIAAVNTNDEDIPAVLLYRNFQEWNSKVERGIAPWEEDTKSEQ